MFTSAIRTAITKTGRTDSLSRGSDLQQVSNPPQVKDLQQVSDLQQVNNPQQASVLTQVSVLLQVSSQVLSRARCKTISGNNWTGPIKTGARGHKTITGHNNTSNKTEVDQAAQAEAAQVVPGLPVVAGDGKYAYIFCYCSVILAVGPFVFFRFDQSLIERNMSRPEVHWHSIE